MRAVTHHRYGPVGVLQFEEVPVPVCGPGDVLVRVHATTVNRTDTGLRSASPFISRFFTGWRRPRQTVLGSEFAGVVAAVGADVTEFVVGDEVFGAYNPGMGTHAEYVRVPARAGITHKPAGITFEQAAASCDGMVLARMYLRPDEVGPGTRVAVYGASGAIGTAGVQLAKAFGAEVTAITDTRHLDMARSIGADVVIDYTTTDFTVVDRPYDVVFDSVGKLTFWRCRRMLTPKGLFCTTDLGPGWQAPLLTLLLRRSRGRRMRFPIPTYSKAEVAAIRDLLAAGQFRPVIDRVVPFDELIEVTPYVESAQKTGNVVVSVVPAGA